MFYTMGAMLSMKRYNIVQLCALQSTTHIQHAPVRSYRCLPLQIAWGYE